MEKNIIIKTLKTKIKHKKRRKGTKYLAYI